MSQVKSSVLEFILYIVCSFYFNEQSSSSKQAVAVAVADLRDWSLVITFFFFFLSASVELVDVSLVPVWLTGW
jgi:hypothetical protein